MRTTMTRPRSASPDTVYLVLEDFGEFGRAYRETDPTRADRQSVLADLLAGQYERPLRIVAFNTTEGWARDVSAEIFTAALARADAAGDDLPLGVRESLDPPA
jgi:hypothetical protein